MARRRLPTWISDEHQDPAWTLTIGGVSPELERVHGSLLTLADGRIGTRGSPLAHHPSARPEVLAAGAYDGDGPDTRLISCPLWTGIGYELRPDDRLTRTLDLRTGVLYEHVSSDATWYRSLRFSSLTTPGVAVLIADVARSGRPEGAPLTPPDGTDHPVSLDGTGRRRSALVTGTDGAVAAAASQSLSTASGHRRLRRVAAYDVTTRRPRPHAARRALAAATELGFERLLAEHQAAWGRRWAASDIRIEGDPALQHAVRIALFHLMASVADRGEAAVGARGLSGAAYRGHVFWDSDVFVLPFLAATHPASARAMLRYRARRLKAARAEAGRMGRAGARFPWESAASGEDVTPHSARDWSGRLVPIRTGQREDHIVADVAWAAMHYASWTGDARFLAGAGRRLLVETARFWASRVRFDREGRAHIYGVVGPDEYHEPVDDNAFTNVMARWNLRRAAELASDPDVGAFERLRWREIADALVDGYDPRTRRYEEFDGFYGLEPIIVTEVAPSRPVSGEALFGRERLRGSQVVKQADVLMLHHLVPEETAPRSLVPNLDFYEPRTAHGSSLSPGIHASLLARAGRMKEAIAALDLASRMDLDDLSGTTAGGLHLATMGSVWQALVFGFAGIRPEVDALRIDPRVPGRWKTLEVRVRYRGVPVVVRAERRSAWVRAERPVAIRFGEDGHPVRVGRTAVQLGRKGRTAP